MLFVSLHCPFLTASLVLTYVFFVFFVFLHIKLDMDENVNKDILHVLYNTLVKISAEIK